MASIRRPSEPTSPSIVPFVRSHRPNGRPGPRNSYHEPTGESLFTSDSPPTPSIVSTDFDPLGNDSDGMETTATTCPKYIYSYLPSTATPDLAAATIQLRDPDHIEALYDVNRKRMFQLLVRRYMHQLLYGCVREGECTVPTCWTARKRLAGDGSTAGVGQGRQLTVLSARIMACHLASRENPLEALCDGKPVPVGLGAKGRNLVGLKARVKAPPRGQGKYVDCVFSKQAKKQQETAEEDENDGAKAGEEQSDISEKPTQKAEVSKRKADIAKGKEKETLGQEKKPERRSYDKGAKDTKSFTQMLFDTKPMKMLEWLAVPPPLPSFLLTPLEPWKEESRKEKDGFFNLEQAGQKTPTKEFSDIEISGRDRSIQDSPVEPEPWADEPPNNTPKSPEPKTLMSPPPTTPLRSPTPPPPAAHKRRETLHEVVTPTPHSNLKRASSQDPPQTPIAPPPLHLNQRQHRRERPAYQQPQSHHHQSQFTEHFYGLPPPQQTPSRAPAGNAAKQFDYLGSLTPTDPSPSGSPKEERNGLSFERLNTIPPPQSLSHLSVPLVRSLFRICAHPDIPTEKQAEAELFSRQSIFYCLSCPEALEKSFRPEEEEHESKDNLDLDMMTTAKIFRVMTWKWETTVLKSLWKGLESLYKYKAAKNDMGKIYGITHTPITGPDGLPPSRQHMLDDYTATRMLVIAMHALVALLPRDNSLQPFDGEGDWLAIRALRGHGLSTTTLDIGNIFENELAERLMTRVVKALEYRIDQTNLRLPEGEENPVIKHLKGYFRKAALMRMEQLKAKNKDELKLVDKKLTLSHRWSLAGAMLEWARTVFLKGWDGNEEVKRGTMASGGLILMSIIYSARKDLYLNEEIFSTPLIPDRLDPKEVPIAWFQSEHKDPKDRNSPLHLIDHPFLFPPSALVTYFRSINLSIMTKAYESALSTSSLLRQVSLNQYFPSTKMIRDRFVEEKLKIASTTYLLLGIRREHILEDAFNAVYKRELRELLKPLKIKFLNSFEEGVDQGGPQYEFFNVLMKEVMESSYGMFADTDNVNHVNWFSVEPLEPLHKYELLGVLMGIAVFNGVTLPVNFPLVFYKKFLGAEAEGLGDLEDGWPELVRGLKELLAWRMVMKMGWDCVYDVGKRKKKPALAPRKGKGKASDNIHDFDMGSEKLELDLDGECDGEPPFVTNANRDQYVKDYIAWLTTLSVSPQFNALRTGFLTIIPPRSFSLFTPSRLKSLVEGIPTIDITQLESITKYDDGYDQSHPTIREFWSVVRAYSQEERRALLEFVTASDRVPVNGLGSITFVIQRNGEDSELLPTSMTCFGRLLLPEYATGKGKVAEKMKRALENSRGFGII
ncbi:hypothetical protein BDZ91DRAFT_844889 [Kalaharituber pfeilii]|nr:hypothetical protein BDZ91DRAFT_844889 [Kalaharituber pfeilii]